jgi:hypothetical protein
VSSATARVTPMKHPPATSWELYKGWVSGLLIIVIVLAVGMGFWFHFHP